MKFRGTLLLKCACIAACVAFAVVTALFGVRYEADASAFGPSASHTNAPAEDNCTTCHSSFGVNTGSGSVAVSGIPHDYIPGRDYQVTVTTSQDTGVT